MALTSMGSTSAAWWWGRGPKLVAGLLRLASCMVRLVHGSMGVLVTMWTLLLLTTVCISMAIVVVAVVVAVAVPVVVLVFYSGAVPATRSMPVVMLMLIMEVVGMVVAAAMVVISQKGPFTA